MGIEVSRAPTPGDADNAYLSPTCCSRGVHFLPVAAVEVELQLLEMEINGWQQNYVN